MNSKILSPCKNQVYLTFPPYYMQTEYTSPNQTYEIKINVHGFVTFEQSNREHDQITVEEIERHARLPNHGQPGKLTLKYAISISFYLIILLRSLLNDGTEHIVSSIQIRPNCWCSNNYQQ